MMPELTIEYGETQPPAIRLERCAIERYPVWHIYKVVSEVIADTFRFSTIYPLFTQPDGTVYLNGTTYYTVDIGLPGQYIVRTRQEQSEIKTCLAYERSR